MRPGYCDKDGVSLFIEEDLSKVADRMGLKHVTDSVALSSLKFVDAYDRNVIPANDLFRSDFMRINLDFANGQSTIVTLPLKDPEFKKFVDKCMPAPAPPEKPCPPRPVPWQAPAQITYEGTADGFAAALPGFLNRAIGANRFPAQPVDSQVATIVEQVKNCASITPQMVEAATARCGIDFTKMADHYKRCDDLIFLPSFKAPRPDRPNFTRDPYLRIFPRGTWGDGSGLTVMIQSQTFYIRAHIEQSSPSATGQTAPVAQQPVLPIQNPDLPSTAEVWKGFTMAYTKRLVRDPNPQAPANCTIPANSEVEVKAGGPDSSGRITVSTIGQPAYKAAPCSYLFYTTSDNLRK